MGLLDLIGHKYPFTDFHELNLDWCITAVLQLQKAFEDFSAGNKLIFADPLQHDLTKTYAKNTIVMGTNGNAYMSLKPVPVGVALTNTDYWLMVFDFEDYTEKANKNFTDNYFSNTDRAPYALAVNDWVVLDDVLYKVTQAIAADELFVIDTNIEHFTVEQFLKDFTTSIVQTVNQYKADIDASELLYRQQLALDIANTVASLQAQLDAAISGATVDSEVINARVSANGIIYDTLGNAIRGQITDQYNNIVNLGKNNKIELMITYNQGRIYNNGGALDFTASNYYISTDFLLNDTKIEVTPKAGYQVSVWSCAYDEIGHAGLNISDGYKTTTIVCTPDPARPYIVICVQNVNTSSAIYISEDTLDIVKFDISDYADKASVAAVSDKLDLLDDAIFRPFSNDEVNHFVHEYFHDSATDLSTVAKIRIYNGNGGLYGFKLYKADNTQVVDCTFSSAPSGVVNKFAAYAVFANLSDLGATYKDFDTTVTPYAKMLETMPAIYAYMKTKVIDDAVFGPFSNDAVNHYVKEYYQASATDLTTVTRIRIYNGQGGLYGFKLFKADNTQVVDCTVSSMPDDVVHQYAAYAVFANLSDLGATYKDFDTTVTSYAKMLETMPTIYSYINNEVLSGDISSLDARIDILELGASSSCTPTKGQILYTGDTKSNADYIVNAVSYADGVIIACRSDGTVVRIGYSGTEETLLTIPGTGPFDWRGCYIDSNENVYVSPHASYGSMNVSDRGLYKLEKGANSFTKVISLYDPASSVPTETENNDDTIWTMCEDDQGNLYAGVYAHTIRPNPAIYKSTDGGDTWTYFYNFRTAGDTPNGLHIHAIIWSKWQKALYVIVGEINTIFRSDDGATTWENLHVTLTVKGSSMLATQFGILIGSDGAYNCDIDLLENDNTTHRKLFSGWANTIFAIRQSDVTGIVYAFTKIDSSVNSLSYYPPVGALTDPDVIDTWHNDVGDTIYDAWKAYYDSVIDTYPDDAIRPQHYAILVSRDGGDHWDVLKAFTSSSEYANGFWTIGYFNNGECLAGQMIDRDMTNPIVISEGRHKYVSGGCDLDGEIFVRTNASDVVTVL